MRKVLRGAIAALTMWAAASVQAGNLDQQIQAVEQIRGLKFTAPVAEVTVQRSELPARLRDQFTKTLPYSVEEWALMLRALHLVDADSSSLVSSLLNLYQEQVLAWYDPLSHTYYDVAELPAAVRDLGPAAVLQQGVAIHELTHALQDQWFHVGEADLALRNDADAAFALHALAEGEATLVMLAWMVQQSGGSLDDLVKSADLVTSIAAAATRAGSLGSDAPPYFVEMMKFPYLDGLHFVIEAYRRGGWKELDRVWADPPRTTREVLHPADYFDRRFRPERFTFSPPVPLQRLLSVEHLGEFHWAFLVGASNARGWNGDRVTIAQDAFCEPTVLVETRWDTEADARRFYDSYLAFLDRNGVGALTRIDGRKVEVGYGSDLGLVRRFLART